MISKLFQVCVQFFAPIDKSSDVMTISNKFRDDIMNFFPAKKYNFLEIGCYRGLTAKVLANHFVQYLGIDINWRTLLVAKINNISHPNVKFKRFDLYNSNWSNLDFPADIVFVDADHSYKSVQQDINNCIKTYKNAFIVFDDYGAFPGVYKAVNEAIAENRLEKLQEIGAKQGELNCANTNSLGSEGLICRVV